MRMRLIFQCLCGCVLLAVTLQLQPVWAKTSSPELTCEDYSRDLKSDFILYSDAQASLQRAQDALKFWAVRHDQLLREQTEYLRTHLRPNPAIQRALDYALTQMTAKRQEVIDQQEVMRSTTNTSEVRFIHMIEKGCKDLSVVRQYIAEHPGRLADALVAIQATYGPINRRPGPRYAGPDWSGVYTNEHANQIVQISGHGQDFTAYSYWTQPGSVHTKQGSDETWACRARGNLASCYCKGDYHDPDKTIHYKATIKLSISGPRLSVKQHIDEATCQAQKVPTCDKLGYVPAIHGGAEFSSTLSRS